MSKILSEAISYFNNKNYIQALKSFEQAVEIYGEKVISFHIKKCHEALQAQGVSVSNQANKVLPIIGEPKLDPATKILLQNQKKLTLSDTDRAQVMGEWKTLTANKSKDAALKSVNPIPSDWPKDLVLAPLPEGPNDYRWAQNRVAEQNHAEIGLSVIIPTFNRSWILDITLACMVNQNTTHKYEVIVADDGSKEQIVDIVRKYEDKLDIKYVRQRDYGYQLCAVRNLGLRTAKYPYVSILDCDMAPNPKWVHSYVERLIENDNVALIGPRRYVDTHGMSGQDFLNDPTLVDNLPETKSNNTIASTQTAVASIDWRLEHFAKTDNLRLCDSPFRYFSGGNVAFARKWLDIAGWFDEEFTHWGGEDNEFGYRLFKHGCYFQSLDGGMAYHQEPPGKENETDREEGKKITINIVKEKVPYFYRKLTPLDSDQIRTVPLVSVYVPAYNCADTIVRCVDSALNQTIVDLEVCVCNDGSTDNTLEVLYQHYGKHPRVRIMSKENGGIATASNAAVKMARGYYIGQLDSDDYLEPDAIELCLKEFLKDRKLVCVYTTNRNVNPDGSLIADGYNWPEFSREKFLTAMIVHHFRMFTARAWYQSGGWNEHIANSVDYDIYLKLSEIGEFKHVNKISYNRVLHGNNTSIRQLDIQKKNHFIVVNDSLKRQKLANFSYEPLDDDDASRKYKFEPTGKVAPAAPKGKIAFSIVFPDKLTNLTTRVENIINYNPETVAIVLTVNKLYLSPQTKQAVENLAEKHKIRLILNIDMAYDGNSKFRQYEYYLDNLAKLEAAKIEADYIVFDAFDSLYVLPESLKHMQKFDVGMNFGDISGYWQKAITEHKTLRQFIAEHLPNIKLDELKAKGVAQGMFIKYGLAKELAKTIRQLAEQCSKNKDMPKYLTEEIWFQTALLIWEKQQNKKAAKTGTLTYLPWDRKLQWTTEQISEAKKGNGIPKYRYCINSVL